MTAGLKQGIHNKNTGVPKGDRRGELSGRLAVLLLVALGLLAFAPVYRNELVDWDDPQNLVHNDGFKGFGSHHLRWMFTTYHGGHYHPLTWLSFAFDYRVWGGTAVGYHLTNVLLHLATAIALFAVTRQLIGSTLRTRNDPTALGHLAGANAKSGLVDADDQFQSQISIPAAFVAAAVFAVHPLRVESVAWATERRDVLSGLMLLLAVYSYIRAATLSARDGRYLWLMLSVGWYLASLLSKAAGIILPAALLILDVFPLQRWSWRGNRRWKWRGDRRVKSRGRQHGRDADDAGLRSLLLEKLPFAGLAVMFAVIAARAQAAAGAMWSLQEHPLSLRIGQAFYGIVFYIAKTFWPLSLSPLYEQDPGATPLDWQNVLAALIACAFTAIAIVVRRKHPALLTAWLLYLVILSPVLGIFQSGPQLVADRYSYLACMPLAVLIGWCVAILWSRFGGQPGGRPGGQIRGRFQSIGRPGLGVLGALTLLAMVAATRAQVGVWRDSKTLWQTVIDRGGSRGLGNANLANVYLQEGDYHKAGTLARLALETLPGNRAAHAIVGRSEFVAGRLEVAVQHLRRAVDIGETVGKPDLGSTVMLSGALRRLGHDDADVWYIRAVSLESRPGYYYEIGQSLARQGRHLEAIENLSVGLRLAPQSVPLRLLLAQLLCNSDDRRRAVAILEDGLQLSPGRAELRAQLAWMLATAPEDDLRDVDRALALVHTDSADVGEQSAPTCRALAAALAESGRFDEAARTLDQLLLRLRSDGHTEQIDAVVRQRDAHLHRQPWRECD